MSAAAVARGLLRFPAELPDGVRMHVDVPRLGAALVLLSLLLRLAQRPSARR
jgi:hypothetical protein